MKLFLALLLGLTASAKTVLISDIDDTLKVAHIRSTVGKVANAFRTKNVFLGMNDLIAAVKIDSDAEVYYLTNAPVSIMKRSHTSLLKNGKFPSGKLLMRQTGVSSNDHKRIALQRIMETDKPDTVVLIGDNGEKDIKFYNTIAKRFPGIKFHTFIRIAYSIDADHAPMKGQYGFISPLEITAKLYNEGLISLDKADKMFDFHGPRFVADRQNKRSGFMYLPKWLTCRGHLSFNTLFAFAHPQKDAVRKKIQKVCAK
jgi:hypothetical protein